MKTIFVSSTFRDMHFERDAIQEITLPLLRAEAAQYGEGVSFCDLRWGINTGELDSEEGARKVLDVCLDEIDRCKPPMVVILGDRYGWIPSEALTVKATERKSIDKAALQRDIALEDLRISVTALEIAYGALATEEKRSRTLFYFRHIESECPDGYTAEDAEHQEKLQRLKARIQQLTEGRIKHYTVRWNGERLDGVASFAEMLAEDIRDALLPEWKQKELLSPFERERLTHWAFIAEKNEMFSARHALVQKYYDILTQNDRHFLAIKAPSGSGKSMLFSHLALKLRKGGFDVLPFMSGLTAESNDSLDILRNTVYYLEDLLGLSHQNAEWDTVPAKDSADADKEAQENQKSGIFKLRERLLELCKRCEETQRRVVIMVDAVDQLSPDDNRDNLIFLPDELSPSVKFVMTCLPELPLGGRSAVTLKPMDDFEKREVIIGILHSHNRELEERVIRKMISLRASRNPLFLSLLVQRLLMMNREDFLAIKKSGDDMNAISKHQLEVITTCPDSLQKMSATLLTEAGRRINENLVRAMAQYLAVSRHGLRQEDLAALLGDQWSALDFAHFITYMHENFIQRDDGRFDFSHKCIREGFLEFCGNKTALHQAIASHLYGATGKDPVCASEIAYHCIRANDPLTLRKYILDNMQTKERLAGTSKTLLHLCEKDECAWLKTLAGEDGSAHHLPAFAEFVVHTFDLAASESPLHCRLLLRISQWLCDMLKTAQNDYASTAIEALMWHAECNKRMLRVSFYSEGNYLHYVSAYREAYAIAEGRYLSEQDPAWLYYMAECAFQIVYYTPLVIAGTPMDVPLRESFCRKAVNCFEKITEESAYGEILPKYAICLVRLAFIEECHGKVRQTKVEAVNRGENPHIQCAIQMAQRIDEAAKQDTDLQYLCVLYQELADYFYEIQNEKYKNTATYFLEKNISLLQRCYQHSAALSYKQMFQSLLIKYAKYSVSFDEPNTARAAIADAMEITKELYAKLGQTALLNNVITLYGLQERSDTQRFRDFSNGERVLQTVYDTAHYLYRYAPMSKSDSILMRAIEKNAAQLLSPARGNAPPSTAAMLYFSLSCLMRSPKKVKDIFWLTPFYGMTSKILKEYVKAHSRGQKALLKLNRTILFFLTVNHKKKEYYYKHKLYLQEERSAK